MLTPSQVTRSLLLFVAAIVVAGVFVGHVVAAAGVALFVFLLAVIEGKPSWRRAFDPDRKREAGIFGRWTTDPPRPNDRRNTTPP